VAVTQRYERFQSLLDFIQLDYAYNYQAQIDELTKIATESALLQPIPDIAMGYVSEMKQLAMAITEYRDSLKENDKHGFEQVIAYVTGLSDESLGKHRLLIGCYYHLASIALAANQPNEASGYQVKQKHHSAVAFRIANKLNRAANIAKINYAATLINGGELQEMNKGYDLLIQASKETPQNAII
jgi:hypothetical protein